jgi:hypothetical protein
MRPVLPEIPEAELTPLVRQLLESVYEKGVGRL